MTLIDPLTAPSDLGRIHELTIGDLREPAPVIFERSVHDQIAATVGSIPAESGGMLGGRRNSSTVEHFFRDDAGATTATTYYPDMAAVNRQLREQWNPAGVNLLGFIHSHPRGSASPSMHDRDYSRRIITAIPAMTRMLLPIVQSVGDGTPFALHSWSVDRDGARFDLRPTPYEVRDRGRAPDLGALPEFARVHDAYDLPAMAGSRIVAVGCGGSAQFLIDLARTGVGEFVLIDPDVVEAPNVGTQHVTRHDLGLPKVHALARRIVAVSPTARVLVVQASSDDLDDAAFTRLVASPLPGSTYVLPTATLLCAFTDTFAAQARIARLGLHLRVPVLSATVYREGRGAEITFAASGVTPACIRCAQSSRYRAYVQEGFVNDVTSHGTPLWATARLNSAKAPIALALLHRTSTVTTADHPATQRYGQLLDDVGDRNLVLISLDTDPLGSLGIPVFADAIAASPAMRTLDLTLWRRPTPDRPGGAAPTCPDCGGSGDFDALEGTFLDTRPMPDAWGEQRFPVAESSPVTTVAALRCRWWRRLVQRAGR